MQVKNESEPASCHTRRAVSGAMVSHMVVKRRQGCRKAVAEETRLTARALPRPPPRPHAADQRSCIAKMVALRLLAIFSPTNSSIPGWRRQYGQGLRSKGKCTVAPQFFSSVATCEATLSNNGTVDATTPSSEHDKHELEKLRRL